MGEITIGKARRLKGKPVQEAVLERVSEGVQQLVTAGHRPPHLVAILVGDDPASAVYVRTKTRTCERVGITSRTVELPASTTTAELVRRVRELNDDAGVDGILVQLPLPPEVDTNEVLETMAPEKDVDGLHPENAGRLVQGRPRFVPATPAGIVELLEHYEIPVSGQRATVVGRSEIVGKPTAMLLLHRHATVTICHSRTRNLAAVTRQADLLVAAVGRPALITPEHVKPGATVVDVGINRVTDRHLLESLFGEDADWDRYRERGYLLAGDVHPRVAEVAGAITPVPGGVGPLTVALLMSNTLQAARRRRGQA